TGRYFTLSTGRVQGPTLSFVADREEKINLHVPVPKFKINLSIKSKSVYDLKYQEGELKIEKEGEKVISQIEGNLVTVNDINKKEDKIKPPVPYRLYTLQKDASRYFGFEPSRTLRAAQKLYLEGVTSYPRTGSEKYPPQTDHKLILSNLAKMRNYQIVSNKVIKTSQKLKNPQEGKETDPAHPCLHPTGELPGKLGNDEMKVYSLIVHRYFATFGEHAVIENTKVFFDVSSHIFNLSGKRTLDKGWRSWTGPYSQSKDNELPNFKVGDTYKINKLTLETLYSSPPAKYTQSSLLSKMEKVSIGTKATRADIIKNLFDRKFLRNKPLDITLMGDTITEVLKKYSPQVISVDLSRKLETMGDLIQETIYDNKDESDSFTLSDALVRGITLLHQMLEGLMLNQKQIGELIDLNLVSQRRFEAIIGDCMNCDDGKLKLIRSLTSGKRFVGCSNYFTETKCDTTYPLPQKEKLDLSTANCVADNYPTLRVFPIFNPEKKRQRPWLLCLNPECPKRKERQEEIERSKQRAKDRKLKKTTKRSAKKTTKKTRKRSTKK
ncbi:MAG: DNA topoisomerase, partial [Candidatus Kariarchaeaceae archaeon]